MYCFTYFSTVSYVMITMNFLRFIPLNVSDSCRKFQLIVRFFSLPCLYRFPSSFSIIFKSIESIKKKRKKIRKIREREKERKNSYFINKYLSFKVKEERKK